MQTFPSVKAKGGFGSASQSAQKVWGGVCSTCEQEYEKAMEFKVQKSLSSRTSV